jgi:hypothetical protein
MASIIRIKRSTGVAAPGSLKTGEIAYTYGTGTAANLGDRLFFGKGDDGGGNATSVVVIGGEYFANLLDHTPGTLTATSAIITDADNKIDVLNVDNITINGNTISSTNTDGNVTIDPNGTGAVDVSNSKIINLSTPTSAGDAATKGYVDAIVGGDTIQLQIAGDTGTGDITLADSDLRIAGGTGLTSVASGTTITINLDNTAVTPNTYGSATAIPVITIDQQGRITSASTATISTTLNISAEAGTGSVSLIDSSLSIAAGEGINTTAIGNTITISGEDATTSNKGIAQFSADNFAVSGGEVTIKNGGVSNDELVNSSVTVSGATIALGGSATLSTTNITEGTNLYYTVARADSDAKNAVSVTDAGGDGSLTYNPATGIFTYTGPSAAEVRAHLVAGTGVTYDSASGVIAIGQAVGTSDNVTFNDLVIQGNLQVNGTTTTINTENIKVADNMIYLNDGESAGSPTQFVDVGWTANVNDTGTFEHVGMFRDATDGIFKLYQGYTPDPDSDVQINVGHPTFAFAPLRVATLTGIYLGFDSDFGTKTTTNLTEGSNLYYTDERVDDRVANLLLAGEGIDLTYVDNNGDPGALTIAAELATISNPGVANFDSDQFTVTSGLVTVAELDGGTF